MSHFETFAICYAVVGAVLGLYRALTIHLYYVRCSLRMRAAVDEHAFFSTAVIWMIAWPLFLPLLFWKR
jgi:hypothetical protein